MISGPIVPVKYQDDRNRGAGRNYNQGSSVRKKGREQARLTLTPELEGENVKTKQNKHMGVSFKRQALGQRLTMLVDL